MEYLLHAANVLYLLSYSVRDILWLRVLTLVALLSSIPFYIANEIFTPVYWSVLFFAINGYQLYRLLLERRPVRLTSQQAVLHDLAFSSLSARDFLKLLALGEWTRHDDDEVLVEAGQQPRHLTVVTGGSAVVRLGDDEVATLSPGQFIGEMSYVSGTPPSAAVVVHKASRCVKWEAEKLRAFLAENLDIKAAVQNILGSDLASKLRERKAAPA